METWKPIRNYPGYEVSCKGRVRSLDRTVERNGHMLKVPGCILKPGTGAKGHKYVNLRHNGTYTSNYVHRLVCIAFVGNPPKDKPQVAHFDGNPANNQASNLRWVSQAENSQDSIRHGTSKRPGGQNHFRSKLSDHMLKNIFFLAKNGYSGRKIATQYNMSHRAINDVLKGRSYVAETKRLGLTRK